jgi:hypothetical protein
VQVPADHHNDNNRAGGCDCSTHYQQGGQDWQYGNRHAATRTFQALRIAVNDELRAREDHSSHPALRLVVGAWQSSHFIALTGS